ncbi:hypothetical protein [Sinanaerobacter sp. ZZT-01]|nr:hypothetical protein [Sinanaerobacter sp. ZZT-01]WRR94345.1 hypothetical protein U5921_04315 [Sinanaerobacter sp. ZZT-01]
MLTKTSKWVILKKFRQHGAALENSASDEEDGQKNLKHFSV